MKTYYAGDQTSSEVILRIPDFFKVSKMYVRLYGTAQSLLGLITKIKNVFLLAITVHVTNFIVPVTFIN